MKVPCHITISPAGRIFLHSWHGLTGPTCEIIDGQLYLTQYKPGTAIEIEPKPITLEQFEEMARAAYLAHRPRGGVVAWVVEKIKEEVSAMVEKSEYV